MRAQDQLEQWLLKQADQWIDRRPQRPVPPQRLARARLVAHRGAYDNQQVFENTIPAFERFRRAGGWGIELDVRWTRDGVPVISHDPDGRRLFSVDGTIAEMDMATLRRRLPLVPSLADIVARFGGRLHLMVEIKCLPPRDRRSSAALLQRHFEGLTPSRDYHFLSLDYPLLQYLVFTPREACIPIARVNFGKIRRRAEAYGWGGVAGHYILIRRRQVEALHQRGFRVGTGFVNSPNSLYRELNRGVDWLFSDRPLQLQRMVSASHPGQPGDGPRP
jgi:glycerophosphoryl diester phosphodiesterase